MMIRGGLKQTMSSFQLFFFFMYSNVVKLCCEPELPRLLPGIDHPVHPPVDLGFQPSGSTK